MLVLEMGLLLEEVRDLRTDVQARVQISKKDYLWECLFTPKNFLAEASSLSV